MALRNAVRIACANADWQSNFVHLKIMLVTASLIEEQAQMRFSAYVFEHGICARAVMAASRSFGGIPDEGSMHVMHDDSII